MTVSAEQALFLAPTRGVTSTASIILVTVAVLVLNVGLQASPFSIVACLLALMMLAYGHVHARRAPPRLAIAGVACGVLGAGLLQVFAQGDATAWLLARLACGAAWALWLASMVDWVALRALLLAVGVPQGVVWSLDQSVLHGLLTVRQWCERRDAARMRLGKHRLSPRVWATVLAEGAWQGLQKIEQAQATHDLRAALGESGTGGAIAMTMARCSVAHHGARLLNDVSLTLQTGEWVALAGVSGAGKSSLLRAVAGLHPLSAGRITRLGRTLGPSASAHERLDGRVALLTQNPEHHFVASTVAEDIAWALLQRGGNGAPIAPRVNEISSRLGLGGLMHRPCHALSFGEQRRVALAGLLVTEPALLLLDEPTAGLDPVTAQRLVDLIRREVQARGVTCLWATHDLHLLPEAISRVVLLAEGAVMFDGAVDEGLSEAWLRRAGLAAPRGPGDRG